MQECNRDSVNKWGFNVDTSQSYFLCSMISEQTGLTVNFIANSNTKVSGNNLYIYFTEVGTGAESLTTGSVKLSPAGQWTLSLYEQASSTNLDPDDGGVTLLLTETIRVDDNGTAQVGFTGTACSGSGGTVNVYESDGATHISGSPFTAPTSKTLTGADIIDAADGVTVITTLEDADTYQVFLFSGINGGLSNTTYSNSILGGLS